MVEESNTHGLRPSERLGAYPLCRYAEAFLAGYLMRPTAALVLLIVGAGSQLQPDL